MHKESRRMNFHFSTVPSVLVTSEDQLHCGRGENDCHDFENEGHFALEKALEVQVGLNLLGVV